MAPRACALGPGAWSLWSIARGRGPASRQLAAALLLASLTALPLAAQQASVRPPTARRASRCPSRQLSASGNPAPAAAAKRQRPTGASRKGRLGRLWLAAVSGAAAGAALGVEGLNFSAYPPSVRPTRRWRAGVSFGLIGAGLGLGFEAALHLAPGAPPARQFWLGRGQTPLLAGMLAAQVLDYTSTRYFRDRGMPEWLLTDRLVDNRAALLATEAAALAAAVGVAYVLYRTGHPRWARWFEGGYITIGAVSAIANYRYPATGRDLF